MTMTDTPDVADAPADAGATKKGKKGKAKKEKGRSNLVPAVVSVTFTGIAILLAAEGGLAFIGYSVKAPDASWGLMIAEARSQIDEAWWATMFPALMLFMTVLALNLIGDRLAKRFDIREAAL